jgi:hypothetical protein
MYQQVELTESDWPGALMLDEAWLRVRRIFVHTLEAAELWPKTDLHNAFMKQQRVIGERVKSELLLEVLGPTDYACISSETIFGASNQRFRSRLPFILSFGYTLGSGLHNLLDDQSDHVAEVGRLCSAFNLGISIFDLIYDNYPDLFEDFSKKFNEKTLHQLGDDPRTSQDLSSSLDDVSADELRLLLKIIIWFFSRLHSLYDACKREEIWKNLSSLLLKAYRAEIASANIGLTSKSDLLKVSRAKSTLPFAVMRQLVYLNVKPLSRETEQIVDSLVDNVSKIFWLTDDLIDIVRDFQARALNTILVQAVNDSSWSQDPSRNYSVLARLLEGNYVEEAVNDVHVSIALVSDLLRAGNFQDDIATQFRNTVLSYMRNWME